MALHCDGYLISDLLHFVAFSLSLRGAFRSAAGVQEAREKFILHDSWLSFLSSSIHKFLLTYLLLRLKLTLKLTVLRAWAVEGKDPF